MTRIALKPILILPLIAFSLLLLTSCSFNKSPAQTPTPAGIYDVDPILDRFYHDLGGQEVLGPTISPVIYKGGNHCQYTANALMCQNPSTTGAGRFFLWPIGSEMGIGGQPEGTASAAANLTINSDISILYQLMGGTIIVGSPMGNAVYNYPKQRVEQYFERAGFYHLFSEAPGSAHLLPYGKYGCQEACSAYLGPVDFNGGIQDQAKNDGQILFDAIQRLGGETFSGRALTKPYTNADGDLEVIYENLVAYTPANNPTLLRFRPISRKLGMHALPPIPRDPGKGQVIFYDMGGGLGYHVPVIFERFIAEHGTAELSGAPIADTIRYNKENVIRQCFENYCLDYYPQAAEGSRIRLAPLGLRYLDLAGIPKTATSQATDEKKGTNQNRPSPIETPKNPAPQITSPESQAPDKELDLLVNAEKLQIQASESQHITALVYEKGTQQPVSGINVLLEINANGASASYPSSPTDQNGQTSVIILPIPGVSNGTIVSYQVCLSPPASARICKSDAYLIWNIP